LPAGPPETTRRRSITFSPSHGATVMLRSRATATVESEPVAVGV
jgi:hypothetical protein